MAVGKGPGYVENPDHVASPFDIDASSVEDLPTHVHLEQPPDIARITETTGVGVPATPDPFAGIDWMPNSVPVATGHVDVPTPPATVVVPPEPEVGTELVGGEVPADELQVPGEGSVEINPESEAKKPDDPKPAPKKAAPKAARSHPKKSTSNE